MSEISDPYVFNLPPNKFYQRLLIIKEWGRRILLWLFVLVFALFEWHVLSIDMIQHEGPTRQIVSTLLVVLAAGIIEVIFGIQKSLDGLSLGIQAIVPTTRLRSLIDCAKDLSERLDGVESSEKVIIDHFGLDMDHAWDYLKEHVLKDLKNAEIRILILTSDPKKLGEGAIIPKEVKTWCLRALDSEKNILSSLNNFKAQMKRENRRLKVEMRAYDIIPTVHGISIRQPIQVRYISFCHWRGKDYVWGESNYRTIVDTSDPLLKAEANIFQGNFDYLWSQSDDIRLRFSFPEGAEPGLQAQVTV